MQVIQISWDEIHQEIEKVIEKYGEVAMYGVPKNGTIIALTAGLSVDTPQEATIIIDDILDSGATKARFEALYPDKPFVTLFEKTEGLWYQFPWEKGAAEDIEDTITRQLEYLGENPKREGLLGTPRRVVKSWKKLFGGYDMNPEEILQTTFTQKHDQIVYLRDIELYSTCEHHLLPFFGKCSIAYIPNNKVVGVSKLARLMECYSRRMQIQERLCEQIVEALDKYLKPKGAACLIEAQHFCMTSRGIEKQNSVMGTSALSGVFLKDTSSRQELLQLIKGA